MALSALACASRADKEPDAGTGGMHAAGGQSNAAGGTTNSESGGATVAVGGAVSGGASGSAAGGSAHTDTSGGANEAGETASAGAGGGAGDGGAFTSGGATQVPLCQTDDECHPGLDADTLANWAYCTASGCVCNRGTVLDPVTQRCVLLPGSKRFTEPDTVQLLAAAGQAQQGALLLAEYRYEVDHYVNSLHLQRVDASGARSDDAIELWTAKESQSIDSVALASDGSRYLYCGSSQQQVRCGFFTPPEQVTPAVFEAAGQSVAVAFTQATWLIAYRTANTDDPNISEFVLQRLTREGQLRGDPISIESSPGPGDLEAKPLLTATDEAFVLAAPNAEADFREYLHWFSPELTELRAPVDLGHQFWGYGSVAALPGLAAVTLSAPYTSALLVVDSAAGTVKDYAIPGGVKLGPIESLCASSQTIFASWFASSQTLAVQPFRSIDDQPVANSSALEIQWLTFNIGQHVLGAHPVALNGGGSSEVEVVPLPGAN